MKEKWTIWESNKKAIGKFYVDSIIYDIEGLRFKLLNENTEDTIELLFNGFIASLRSTEEGYRGKAIEEIVSQYADKAKDYLRNYTIFVIEDSKYISWLSKESYNIYNYDLKHFVILASDSVVDIITTDEPLVR